MNKKISVIIFILGLILSFNSAIVIAAAEPETNISTEDSNKLLDATPDLENSIGGTESIAVNNEENSERTSIAITVSGTAEDRSNESDIEPIPDNDPAVISNNKEGTEDCFITLTWRNTDSADKIDDYSYKLTTTESREVYISYMCDVSFSGSGVESERCEIRLPYSIFEGQIEGSYSLCYDQNTNVYTTQKDETSCWSLNQSGVTTYNSESVHMYDISVPLKSDTTISNVSSDSPFLYEISDSELIIRNYTELSAGPHYQFTVSYRFNPCWLKDMSLLELTGTIDTTFDTGINKQKTSSPVLSYVVDTGISSFLPWSSYIDSGVSPSYKSDFYHVIRSFSQFKEITSAKKGWVQNCEDYFYKERTIAAPYTESDFDFENYTYIYFPLDDGSDKEYSQNYSFSAICYSPGFSGDEFKVMGVYTYAGNVSAYDIEREDFLHIQDNSFTFKMIRTEDSPETHGTDSSYLSLGILCRFDKTKAMTHDTSDNKIELYMNVTMSGLTNDGYEHIGDDKNDIITVDNVFCGGVQYVEYNYPDGYIYSIYSQISYSGHSSPIIHDNSVSSYDNGAKLSGGKEILSLHEDYTVEEKCIIYYDGNYFQDIAGYKQYIDLFLDEIYWNIGDGGTFIRMTKDDYDIEYRDIYTSDWSKCIYEDIYSGDKYYHTTSEYQAEYPDALDRSFKIYPIINEQVSSQIIKSEEIGFNGEKINILSSNPNPDCDISREDVTGIVVRSPIFGPEAVCFFPRINVKINADSEALRRYFENDPGTEIQMVYAWGFRHFHSEDNGETFVEDLHFPDCYNHSSGGVLAGDSDAEHNYNEVWHTNAVNSSALSRPIISNIYNNDLSRMFYSDYTSGGIVRSVNTCSFTDPKKTSDIFIECVGEINNNENKTIEKTFRVWGGEELCISGPNNVTYQDSELMNSLKSKENDYYILLPKGYSLKNIKPFTLKGRTYYPRVVNYQHYTRSIDYSTEVFKNYKYSGEDLVKVKLENNPMSFVANSTIWQGYAVCSVFEITIQVPYEDLLPENISNDQIYVAYQALEDLNGSKRSIFPYAKYSTTGYPTFITTGDSPDVGYPIVTTTAQGASDHIEDMRAKFQSLRIDDEYIFNDINGNGLSSEEINSTIYAYTDFSILSSGFAVTGLTSSVNGVNPNYKQRNYTELSSETERKTYSYRLKVSKGDGNVMKDIVLYDILESAIPEGESGWKGTFDSIDTSYLEGLGITPTIYYSTVSGLTYPIFQGGDTADTWYQDTSIWSTTMPADKSTITAIAIDLGDYEIPDNGAAYVIINMEAPVNDPRDTDQNALYAYNKAAYSSYLQLVGGEPTYTLLSGNITQVGISNVNISVSKVWDDASNWWGDQPNDIQIRLLANGLPVDGTAIQTLNESNGWSYTFERIPVFDSLGSEITYTAEEVSVPEGYIATYSTDYVYVPTIPSGETSYSHTSNISDDGVRTGGYVDNVKDVNTLTMPGAVSLHVKLTFGTESNYDWVVAYKGRYTGSVPDRSLNAVTADMMALKDDLNYIDAYTGKSGDGFIDEKKTVEFDVDGDTISFLFRSDSTSHNFYGYYAEVSSKIPNPEPEIIYDPYTIIITNTHEVGIQDINIGKFDASDLTTFDISESTPLSGAEFELLYWAPGEDITDTAQADNTLSPYISNSFDILHLTDGTYQISEIKPPTGYNITKPIIFSIKNESLSLLGETENVRVYTNFRPDPTTWDTESLLAIFDSRPAELASTGGGGTYINYICGLTTILMGSILLIRKKKV